MARAKLEAGDPAPDVELTLDDGSTRSLASFRGIPVVLYFYPRDETPGCTIQACSFRDIHDDIIAAGAVVLGVSMDSLDRHRRFRERHGLPFQLVADPDGAVIDAFGAWQSWAIARNGLFVNRMTVLIDADGTIRRIWRSTGARRGSRQVLAELKVMQGGAGEDAEGA